MIDGKGPNECMDILYGRIGYTYGVLVSETGYECGDPYRRFRHRDSTDLYRNVAFSTWAQQLATSSPSHRPADRF